MKIKTKNKNNHIISLEKDLYHCYVECYIGDFESLKQWVKKNYRGDFFGLSNIEKEEHEKKSGGAFMEGQNIMIWLL